MVDGQDLLVGDTPEQFAEQTVSLLTSRALYRHIVENARRTVVARYDWDAIADHQLQVYGEWVAQDKRRTPLLHPG